MLYAKLSVLIWNFDPARFKPGETQKIFLPLLYSIAASLIRRGRKKDARHLINSFQKIFPSPTNILLENFIRYFGSAAYVPAKAIAKFRQFNP